MSEPIDIKNYGFIQDDKPMNMNWETSWSFTYALTGIEHGFCSFLTKTPNISYGNNRTSLGYLGDEFNPASGILAIAFDTTGAFALSSDYSPGIAEENIVPNSLIIRDYSNEVVLNVPISELSSNFVIASTEKIYQTIRCRLSNGGKKIHVDFKRGSLSYEPLTSIVLSNPPLEDDTVVYAGLTFCSPVTGYGIGDGYPSSTMFVRNFNVDGTTAPPTREVVEMDSIYEESKLYSDIDITSL